MSHLRHSVRQATDLSIWLAAVALSVALLATSCRPAAKKGGEVGVPLFEFHGRDLARGGVLHTYPGDIGEAAVKLARQVRVPICFEPVETGNEAPAVSIEVKEQNTNVASILDIMIRQDPRYQYRERLDVIEVLPVGAAADRKNCLNMRIPVFRVRYPWTVAIGSLRCQIANVSESRFNIVFDPMRAGCAGRLPGARSAKERPIHATFLFEPVRDILDKIVAESGDAAWTAHFTKPSRACDSLVISGYWLLPE